MDKLKLQDGRTIEVGKTYRVWAETPEDTNNVGFRSKLIRIYYEDGDTEGQVKAINEAVERGEIVRADGPKDGEAWKKYLRDCQKISERFTFRFDTVDEWREWARKTFTGDDLEASIEYPPNPEFEFENGCWTTGDLDFWDFSEDDEV